MYTAHGPCASTSASWWCGHLCQDISSSTCPRCFAVFLADNIDFYPIRSPREQDDDDGSASSQRMADDLDTSQIRHWRSIITLIVFVLTSRSLPKHPMNATPAYSFNRLSRTVPFPRSGIHTKGASQCILGLAGGPAGDCTARSAV